MSELSSKEIVLTESEIRQLARSPEALQLAIDGHHVNEAEADAIGEPEVVPIVRASERRRKELEAARDALLVERGDKPGDMQIINGYEYTQPAHEPLTALRQMLCAVGIVGKIDGYDVVRRDSIIDLIDRARARAEQHPPALTRVYSETGLREFIAEHFPHLELRAAQPPLPALPPKQSPMPTVWLYLLSAARQLVEKVDQNHDDKEPPLKWNVPWAMVTALRDAVLKATMEYDRSGQPTQPPGVEQKVREWLYDWCGDLPIQATHELESLIGRATLTKEGRPFRRGDCVANGAYKGVVDTTYQDGIVLVKWRSGERSCIQPGLLSRRDREPADTTPGEAVNE